MKKLIIIALISVFLIGALIFSHREDGIVAPQASNTDFAELCGIGRASQMNVEIGDLVITTEVACTDEEQAQGLSGRGRLALGTGMLFPFPDDAPHFMWMKDMEFPLDMLWISADGTIVHTEEYISPETFPESFSSPVPSRLVLEINAGIISSSGVSVGKKVVISPL